MSRAALVERMAGLIAAVQRSRPVRVAIDGPDAAGKTTLADELAPALRVRGRTVIRASIDGFHRPRAERYRRGEDSAQGYYEDSFDHAALRQELLDPPGPGGTRRYRRAVFDFRLDARQAAPSMIAPEDAVLIFDGVFLLRPELIESWDLTVVVAVSFDETLRRALDRDVALFGSREEVERRYRSRYVPVSGSTSRPRIPTKRRTSSCTTTIRLAHSCKGEPEHRSHATRAMRRGGDHGRMDLLDSHLARRLRRAHDRRGAAGLVPNGSMCLDGRPRGGPPTSHGAFRTEVSLRGVTVTGSLQPGAFRAFGVFLARTRSPPLFVTPADRPKALARPGSLPLQVRSLGPPPNRAKGMSSV
jgi:uridine kinase